jgi:hypothetical protein
MTTLALNVEGLHKRNGIFLGFNLPMTSGTTLALFFHVVSIFIILMVATVTVNDFRMSFMIEPNKRPLVLPYFLMVEHKLIFLRKCKRKKQKKNSQYQ